MKKWSVIAKAAEFNRMMQRPDFSNMAVVSHLDKIISVSSRDTKAKLEWVEKSAQEARK